MAKKKLRGVTVTDILSWRPCCEYTERYIRKLFAKRKKLNAADILKLRIPFEDRLWVICREEMVPDDIFHLWACWCAERALKRERKAGREPDKRSWAVIEAKRQWMRGEISDEDLAVARAAAWDASTAARTAASAARAARAAARDASIAASTAASTAASAARAAARDAGGAVEEKAQRRKLIKMLEAL